MSGNTIFRTALLALSIADLLLLSGCGGNAGGSSSGPPVESVVSVSINPAPPISIRPGEEVPIAATVINGSSGVVVEWSCLPADVCGTFSPGSTSSNAPTTYTAPSLLLPGGYVTITATYLKNSLKNALNRDSFGKGIALTHAKLVVKLQEFLTGDRFALSLIHI